MIDFHSHTNVSYCADKEMKLSLYKKEIEGSKTLEEVFITDHGMAIYFPRNIAWRWEFIRNESLLDRYIDVGNSRLEKYINSFSGYRDSKIHSGMEVEMSENGRLIYDPFYRDKLFPLIGSVHFLFSSRQYEVASSDILREWIYHTEKLISSGIDILGHPFRWICDQVPIEVIPVERIVKYANKEGVTLELNGHNTSFPIHEADKIMVKSAVEIGAKISFGVDAHRKKDIGDFSYHIKLLDECGLSLRDLKLLSVEELYSRRSKNI